MCWTPPLYMQYRLYGHMSALYVTYICDITEWNYSIWDTLGPYIILATETSWIQKPLNTLQYYTGTKNVVFVIRISQFRGFVTEVLLSILIAYVWCVVLMCTYILG